MRYIIRRAVVVGVTVTVGAAIALFVGSGIRDRVLDVYVLAVGGVLMLALFRAIRMLDAERAPSSFDRALAAMRAPLRRGGELATERDIELSRVNALHYHVRVRPVLREIAAHRLRLQYGLDLDRDAVRARELVPTRAWEVVRPDRPPPADRLARGPSVSSQRAVLDELERL